MAGLYRVRLLRPLSWLVGTFVLMALMALTALPAAAQTKSGVAPPAAQPATQPKAPTGSAGAKAPSVPSQIDINRATSADLEAVPGIGKVYAARIIAGRPYANKAQLVQRGVLTQALYDKIKDRLIAKQ